MDLIETFKRNVEAVYAIYKKKNEAWLSAFTIDLLAFS